MPFPATNDYAPSDSYLPRTGYCSSIHKVNYYQVYYKELPKHHNMAICI